MIKVHSMWVNRIFPLPFIICHSHTCSLLLFVNTSKYEYMLFPSLLFYTKGCMLCNLFCNFLSLAVSPEDLSMMVLRELPPPFIRVAWYSIVWLVVSQFIEPDPYAWTFELFLVFAVTSNTSVNKGSFLKGCTALHTLLIMRLFILRMLVGFIG